MIIGLEERRFLELFLQRGCCEVEFVSGSRGTQIVRKDNSLYRVIQKESAILWEMIVCVILSKKVHMNFLLRITHPIVSQSIADSS